VGADGLDERLRQLFAGPIVLEVLVGIAVKAFPVVNLFRDFVLCDHV
jgi:hypothetical protein